jgi:glyoxylase-like metal-dependent hydrolase (beta-lactamase superfamily II)
MLKKQLLLIILISLSALIVNAQNKVAYKVYAIRFASSSYPFTVADWADGGPKTEKVKIDFMVWLIKGNNGKNILVDAGFLGDAEDAKEFKIVNYVRPDSALLKLGVKPGDITDVILSHPHWDHIDGINLFPNAHIWIQKEDFYGFVGTAWQKKDDSGGFAKRDVRKLVDVNLEGRLTLVEGDNKQILLGITVYTGSKHTFNSQYVLVETGINKVILASDNIWIYYNLEHLVPTSTGGTLDPAGYVKAMVRMKTLVNDPKFIIPGHDATVFSKFPKVLEGMAEIK